MAEVNKTSSKYDANLNAVLDAIVADLTALRATVAANVVDVAALDTAIDTLIAKLNLDAGVTDADYAGAADLTSSAPSALTTTTD